MDIFLKVTAGVLITAVLSLVLCQSRSEISMLLIICVCGMVVLGALSYLKPVLAFARRLIQTGQLNNELLSVLLKAVGIGLVSQIAGLICSDAGNQSLGKALQMITTAVILCISLPLLEEILSLLETVLGEI